MAWPYLATRPKPPPPPPAQAVAEVPDDDEVASMGVGALRKLIVSAGLSHRDCIEKPELRTRALEAAAKLRGAP